ATLGFVLAAGGALAGLEGAGAAVPPQPARIAPVKTAPTNVRTLIISVSLLRESHSLYIAFPERDARLKHFQHILTVGLARSLLPPRPFGLIVEGDALVLGGIPHQAERIAALIDDVDLLAQHLAEQDDAT